LELSNPNSTNLTQLLLANPLIVGGFLGTTLTRPLPQNFVLRMAHLRVLIVDGDAVLALIKGGRFRYLTIVIHLMKFIQYCEY
jgi:hypothetical protein